MSSMNEYFPSVRYQSIVSQKSFLSQMAIRKHGIKICVQIIYYHYQCSFYYTSVLEYCQVLNNIQTIQNSSGHQCYIKLLKYKKVFYSLYQKIQIFFSSIFIYDAEITLQRWFFKCVRKKRCQKDIHSFNMLCSWISFVL